MKYDSTADTLKHIKKVNDIIGSLISELIHRGKIHDESKLEENEKDVFDEFTPKLAGSAYGSNEYKKMLEEMKPALDNHYRNNRHHPEHFHKGINDMNLIDILEMLVDWIASSGRHETGNIYKSIEINTERFHLSDQLKQILINTVDSMRSSNIITGDNVIKIETDFVNYDNIWKLKQITGDYKWDMFMKSYNYLLNEDTVYSILHNFVRYKFLMIKDSACMVINDSETIKRLGYDGHCLPFLNADKLKILGIDLLEEVFEKTYLKISDEMIKKLYGGIN